MFSTTPALVGPLWVGKSIDAKRLEIRLSWQPRKPNHRGAEHSCTGKNMCSCSYMFQNIEHEDVCRQDLGSMKMPPLVQMWDPSSRHRPVVVCKTKKYHWVEGDCFYPQIYGNGKSLGIHSGDLPSPNPTQPNILKCQKEFLTLNPDIGEDPLRHLRKTRDLLRRFIDRCVQMICRCWLAS